MINIFQKRRKENQEDRLTLKADSEIAFRGLKNLLDDFRIPFADVEERIVSVSRQAFDDVVFTSHNLRRRFENPDGITIVDDRFSWQPEVYAQEVMALKRGLEGLEAINQKGKIDSVGQACRQIGKLATPAFGATAMGLVLWGGFRVYKFGEHALKAKADYLESIVADAEPQISKVSDAKKPALNEPSEPSSNADIKANISEPPKVLEHDSKSKDPLPVKPKLK